MSKADFATLVLSKSELEDLRYLSKTPSVDITSEWSNRLSGLYKLGFVKCKTDVEKSVKSEKIYRVYTISETGRRYLQYVDRQKKEKRFTSTVSVVALIASIIAAAAAVASIMR